jgi:hypothetical protein
MGSLPFSPPLWPILQPWKRLAGPQTDAGNDRVSRTPKKSAVSNDPVPTHVLRSESWAHERRLTAPAGLAVDLRTQSTFTPEVQSLYNTLILLVGVTGCEPATPTSESTPEGLDRKEVP